VTDCDTGAELLLEKLLLAGYTAVSVLVPVVTNVIPQLPVSMPSGALHVSPVLAVTVTLPKGTVTPVTWNETVTVCPGSEGFGEFDVIEVELGAGKTVKYTVSVAVV
jgi:hypothetical protein